MRARRHRVIGLGVVATVVVTVLAIAWLLTRTKAFVEAQTGCDAGRWSRLQSVGVPMSPATVDPVSGWMVGSAFVGGHGRTFAARWEAERWKVTPTDNGGTSFNHLNDVSVDVRDHAWAVGAYFDTAKIGRTLIERWDGRAWARVATPDPGPGDAQLLGVTGGPDEAWAVGWVLESGQPASLIERWDGERWSIVPLPDVGTSSLVAVAGSDDDVWAVGRTIEPTGTSRPLILRWDGRTWTPVEVPAVTGWLASVAVHGADRGWAVGGRMTDEGTSPLVLAWDGSAWSQVAVAGASAGALVSVDTDDRHGAWAVGSVSGDLPARPLVVRTDRTEWVAVSPPDAGTPTAVGVGDGAVWVAGVVRGPKRLSPPAIFRCDVSP